MNRIQTCCVTLLLFAFGWPTAARAQFGFDFFGEKKATETIQETKPADSVMSEEDITKALRKTASSYSLQEDGKSLEIRPDPLLNWQNPTRPGQQGLFYVWTNGGRPAVLGSFFTFISSKQLRSKHVLISLSTGSVIGKLDGKEMWAPKKPLLDWKQLSTTQPPSESPARRKLQLSQLARRFAGQHISPEGNVDQLRLMNQPIFRYRSPDQNVIDGAIYSLAIGTDPEALVLLEARRGEGKSAEWFYAFAPSHFQELRGSLDGEEVWLKPANMDMMRNRQGQIPQMYEPYCSFHPSRGVDE